MTKFNAMKLKFIKTIKRMGRGFIVFFIIILLLVDALILLYFYSNSGDIINFINLNPPVQENLGHMVLEYPPIPSTSTVYVYSANSTVQFDIFTIQIYLHYNGTLVESAPVVVEAYFSFIRKDIWTISLGFEGAEPYEGISAQLPYYMFFSTYHYRPRITDQNGNPSPINDYYIEEQQIDPRQLTIIDWTWQGNYYPVIRVIYKNFTQVTQSYPDSIVTVSSVNSIQQEQEQRIYNRLTLGLTVAVFLFTFVGSFDVISRLYKLGWGKNYGKNKNDSAHNPRHYSNHWKRIKRKEYSKEQ